jgi:hypothetical protein
VLLVGGQRVVPDRVDQRAGADGIAGREREPRDQCPQASAGEFEREPVALDLQPTEDADAHHGSESRRVG